MKECPYCRHLHLAHEMSWEQYRLNGRTVRGPICAWCLIGDFEYDPY